MLMAWCHLATRLLATTPFYVDIHDINQLKWWPKEMIHWVPVMPYSFMELDQHSASGNTLLPVRPSSEPMLKHLETTFCKFVWILSVEIHPLSIRKMHSKLSSTKCQPFCPDANVLILYKCVVTVYVNKTNKWKWEVDFLYLQNMTPKHEACFNVNHLTWSPIH